MKLESITVHVVSCVIETVNESGPSDAKTVQAPPLTMRTASEAKGSEIVKTITLSCGIDPSLVNNHRYEVQSEVEVQEMTGKVQAIAQEAAQLERHERVEIIEVLLETLEPESTDDPSDVLSAWQDEVGQRSKELKSGQVTAIPWNQVKDEAEKLFDAD